MTPEPTTATSTISPGNQVYLKMAQTALWSGAIPLWISKNEERQGKSALLVSFAGKESSNVTEASQNAGLAQD